MSLFLAVGCSRRGTPQPVQLKYKATGTSPEILALYEAWFGFSKHISIGYTSHDPAVIRRQIQQAKAMGISAFVVDWYGDREPFIDRSYSLMQTNAAKQRFHVAMMYDESDQEDGATDEAIADFTMFHDTYLSAKSPGHNAYLAYQGRPVIFIWPNGRHTNWDQVRAVVNKWKPAPLLIGLTPPGQYADAFDGFYAWINPGPQGWAADGSHWGEQYLSNFYETMRSKYADKIIVGGAWSQFNDSKASWSLNRHMSARCGQTYQDTFNFWRKYFPADEPIPFVMLETWNDYEEGSAIEPGIPTCGKEPQAPPIAGQGTNSPSSAAVKP
ncbi:MAG: glycoside hydrolase family 71/99 protein [Acidobacteriaceae bacterium]